jgi:hypothetical protein
VQSPAQNDLASKILFSRKISMSGGIEWTSEKVAAVQVSLYTINENLRVRNARLALRNAGFGDDAKKLTLEKLNRLETKLPSWLRDRLADHRQKNASSPARENKRVAEEYAIDGRARPAKMPRVDVSRPLSDRLVEKARDGTQRDAGVMVSDGASREELLVQLPGGEVAARDEITFSFLQGAASLEGASPLLLPPLVVRAPRGMPGARSVVRIAASPSASTETTTLSIDRDDPRVLHVTFVFRAEPLLPAEPEEAEKCFSALCQFRLASLPQWTTAPREAMTYEIALRFSAPLGTQAEVHCFRTKSWKVWIVPFARVEAVGAPNKQLEQQYN